MIYRLMRGSLSISCANLCAIRFASAVMCAEVSWRSRFAGVSELSYEL